MAPAHQRALDERPRVLVAQLLDGAPRLGHAAWSVVASRGGGGHADDRQDHNASHRWVCYHVSVDAPSTIATRVLAQGGQPTRLLRTCELEVLSGPDAGMRARLGRPLFRIGTQASNDLTLTDPTVSKQHLEITVLDTGYRIVDLD